MKPAASFESLAVLHSYVLHVVIFDNVCQENNPAYSLCSSTEGVGCLPTSFSPLPPPLPPVPAATTSPPAACRPEARACRSRFRIGGQPGERTFLCRG